MSRVLVVLTVIATLSPFAGHFHAQGSDNSLTVEGGVAFINPGIPTLPDAEAVRGASVA